MNYDPNINDYVKWKHFEGWVYFKCNEYITIEVSIRPKDEINYEHCSIHRNERLLVICYDSQWNELNYVYTRKSMYDDSPVDALSCVNHND